MKKNYNVLIVDDEKLARKDLKAILNRFHQIKILGEADTLETAKTFLSKNKVNIVFLDIQLGKDSGFELLKHIPSDTRVIFVTAFDEYAIRAFEVNAQDYLLKPVLKERLETTLDNFERSNNGAKKNSENKLKQDDSIFLKMNNNYEFFKINEIAYISASDDYTEVNTLSGDKKLVLKSMKEWEERLPEKQYCRIHRSTIINIEIVEKIEPWFNYSYRVYLNNIEKPLVMSRRYFSLIKEKLG